MTFILLWKLEDEASREDLFIASFVYCIMEILHVHASTSFQFVVESVMFICIQQLLL